MPLNVFSEIGRLRRVLLHRPGQEIDLMVPQMMEHLLFDDILDGEEAREEHETFRTLLGKLGVEILQAEDLLGEVMADAAVREETFAELERQLAVPGEVIGRLVELPPRDLAATLIAGLRVRGARARGALFDLLPVPNYFFQRDPQVVIGDRVMISSMATAAREREPLLARCIFRHHPALAEAGPRFDIHRPPHGVTALGQAYPFPSLEGGDVLVASEEVLLVGISERTNRRGVEVLAEYLRREETSFRHLIAVELPSRRAFMHLDTVFTLIDRGVALGYPPVVHAGTPESARVYRVDLMRDELTFTLGGSLLETLADVGLAVDMVPCGGSEDIVDQQREQWSDGANAFAVAPGVIFLYHRNRRTSAELAVRGWRVLDEDAALAADDLGAAGPTVVTFSGRELSRARGGPRCMTMPLERDPL